VYVGVVVGSVEIKTEADSADITECLHDVKPCAGRFVVSGDLFTAVNNISAFSFCDVCCLCFLPVPIFNRYDGSNPLPVLAVDMCSFFSDYLSVGQLNIHVVMDEF